VFFLASFFLSPVMGVILLLLTGTKPAPMRKCPACAELVLAEATLCKHCHTTLPSLPAGVSVTASNETVVPNWVAAVVVLGVALAIYWIFFL
jgi:hypothetical protein